MPPYSSCDNAKELNLAICCLLGSLATDATILSQFCSIYIVCSL